MCHDADVLVVNMCGRVHHAVQAVEAGCDLVVAQGTEAGGHTGRVATLPLGAPDRGRGGRPGPGGGGRWHRRRTGGGRRPGPRRRRGVARHPLHRHARGPGLPRLPRRPARRRRESDDGEPLLQRQADAGDRQRADHLLRPPPRRTGPFPEQMLQSIVGRGSSISPPGRTTRTSTRPGSAIRAARGWVPSTGSSPPANWWAASWPRPRRRWPGWTGCAERPPTRGHVRPGCPRPDRGGRARPAAMPQAGASTWPWTPWTTLTSRLERGDPPKPTDAFWFPLSSVSNSHVGRSPPGADSTTRSSVPGRKVWTIGSMGILTSVYGAG